VGDTLLGKRQYFFVLNNDFKGGKALRCAIYLRNTAIRIYSVPQLRRKKAFVKISSWGKRKWASQNIFCQPF
jgi:hypothetical protein